MFSPEFTDDVLLVFMLAGPIYLVIRLNLWGIVIGGGFSWFLGVVAGMLLTPYRGASVLDAVWIILGLPFCLFYSALIYGLKRLFLRFWRDGYL
jgi:hypothetical protein